MIDPSDVPNAAKEKFASFKFGNIPEREVAIKKEPDSRDRSAPRPDNQAHINQIQDNHGQAEGNDKKDDDEDECMILDPSDVPNAAKEKFASFKFGSFPEAAGDLIFMGSAPMIKTEDQEDELQQLLAVPSDSSDNEADGSEFELDEDAVLSDGERPRKRQELRALRAQGPLTPKQKVDLARVSARIANVEKMATQQPLGPPQDLGENPPSPSRRAGTANAGQPENLADPEQPGGDAEEDETIDRDVNQQLAVIEGGLAGEPVPATAPTVAEQSGSTSTKQKAPRTAREYWEREYAEKGSGLRNVYEDVTTRRRPLNHTRRQKQTARKNDNTRESKLMRMLKDSNPIMARATQGAMAMPGPVQTTRQTDQLKWMRDLFFRVSENLHPGNRVADMKVLREAIKSFGARKVRAADGRWKLTGLKSTLYNHQLVGVSWMLRQEFSPDGPYGGILADQMGLGKTVQVLATMCANRPTREDIEAGRHITLIVAPATAIDQWEREITKHCESSFISRIHHYRARQNLENWMWTSAQVILASYNEVANAYPSEKTLRRIAGRKLNEEEWAEEFDAYLGELFGNEFFRVVLDEGHTIRNHNTKTARACIQLSSKYRWILTGTPIHNSIDELYPYFRFLGAHWAASRDEFAKQFGVRKPEAGAQERMAVILASIMLRRRVDDHFLGVPLLQIPQTHPTKTVEVDLTTEEALIYRRLHDRFTYNMSHDIKAGVAGKKVTTYLAYLTRLRQAVAHPFLLEGVMRVSFTLEDFAYLRRQLALVGGKTPMHSQVQKWVQMEYDDRGVGAGDGEGNGEPGFGRSRFGCEFNMDAELAEVGADKSLQEVICRVCYDVPVDPRITECGHTFCQECIDGRLKVQPTCPACGGLLFHAEALTEPEGAASEGLDDDDDPFDQSGGVGNRSAKRKRRTARKNKAEREIGDDERWVQPVLIDRSKWIRQYKAPGANKKLLASAKTIAVKNQILIWQREAPEDKIIGKFRNGITYGIFVNWAKLAWIIGRMLFEEGIPFLYYFGSMMMEEKNAALKDFQDRADIKVMVASIRCGAQALNLSFANRVISVDQWWNTAMESQAFGRVHRIGQQKETHFVRIVAKNTVDGRMLAMAHEKEKMAARALQEDDESQKQGGRRRPCALSIQELMSLFDVVEPGREGDGQEGDGDGDQGQDRGNGNQSDEDQSPSSGSVGGDEDDNDNRDGDADADADDNEDGDDNGNGEEDGEENGGGDRVDETLSDSDEDLFVEQEVEVV
ncbi:hypothetical protein C8A03DRAFT_18001 [Achaetomium macrosporum]|uniref:Uncharacterized protein n=1 Tax=Achaetomium macrosporum TaxID=79813 RepID=A0AAN7C5P8_9PEZI|nr:hypothetical protein C8A03DRAFT_18001 [Achaetomium macrosporum]